MIITCPHCQTRYQVATETIGSAGRKVQCAHCGEAWQATPEFPKPRPKPVLVEAGDEYPDDKLFDEVAEAELDAEFAAQERQVSSEKRDDAESRGEVESFADFVEVNEVAVAAAMAARQQAVDPAMARKQQRAFFRRQNARGRQLPLARVRRTARVAVLGCLILLIGGGIFLRVNIVQQFPALAGLYASVGLGVNVVGLDIRDLKTIKSQRGGNDVLSIDARIYSVSNRGALVPPVVVTLFNAAGNPLYEWSVTPQARDLEPGEVIDFTTELPKPPAGATQVKLTFASSRGQNQAAATVAANDTSSETH